MRLPYIPQQFKCSNMLEAVYLAGYFAGKAGPPLTWQLHDPKDSGASEAFTVGFRKGAADR